MQDVAGSAHMTQGALTTFTSDRFGNPNSALALNTGYTIVPSGVYFNTPAFTISVWVYPKLIVGYWARVIDFSNGLATKTILFSISAWSNLPALGIWDTTSFKVGDFVSNTALINNQWQFLVTTFDGTTAKVYINGSLTYSGTITSYSFPTLTRTQNWIGKSAWSTDGYSSSFLDDLRFYSISLSQDEILEIMNSQTTATSTRIYVNTFFSINNTGYQLNDILANYNGDLSACLANCSNQGVCILDSLTNKYICQCNQYRMGKACQTDSRPCSSNPCLNNGTCFNINNDTSFECDCQNPNLFYGIYCENKLDLCQNNNTNVCISPSQGYCIVNGSQPMCKCIMGYTGVRCENKSTFLVVRKYIIDSSTLIAIIVIASYMVLMIFLDCSRYFTSNQVLDKRQAKIKRLYYTP
jgi:hypothetical protein